MKRIMTKREFIVLVMCLSLALIPIVLQVFLCYKAYITFSYATNIIEPFIALVNSYYMIPIVISGLLFCELRPRNPNYIKTKTNRIISILKRTGVYLTSVVAITSFFVTPIAIIDNRWSFQCIKNKIGITVYLYTQLTIGKTLVTSFILIYEFIVVLSLIRVLFLLNSIKYWGDIIIIILLLINVFPIIKNYNWKWILPISNACVAEHYKNIYLGNVFPLWYSLLYFAFISVVLSVLITGCSDRAKE